MQGIAIDSRGNELLVEKNEVGGRRYWSTEIGGGVMVWDTSLVSEEMLELALRMEKAINKFEPRPQPDDENPGIGLSNPRE